MIYVALPYLQTSYAGLWPHQSRLCGIVVALFLSRRENTTNEKAKRRMPPSPRAICTHGVCALLLLLHRIPVRGQQGQQGHCDASCQLAQQQALVSIYTATGGATWHPTSSLVEEPGGWLNTTGPATGLPSHCSWSGTRDIVHLEQSDDAYIARPYVVTVYCAGVFCCVPSGLPDGYPQLILDVNTGHQKYPSAMDVECSVMLGVATLSLARLNLTGTIQELRLGALAPSLTVLDLSGTALRASGPMLAVLAP